MTIMQEEQAAREEKIADAISGMYIHLGLDKGYCPIFNTDTTPEDRLKIEWDPINDSFSALGDPKSIRSIYLILDRELPGTFQYRTTSALENPGPEAKRVTVGELAVPRDRITDKIVNLLEKLSRMQAAELRERARQAAQRERPLS